MIRCRWPGGTSSKINGVPSLSDTLVYIRGGGDLASGVAHRLHSAGFTVMIAELAQPLCVRRPVSFAEAVYTGAHTVESVSARLAPDPLLGMAYAVMGEIPVVVDPDGAARQRLHPGVVVDARLAKRKLDTTLNDAPLVVALGPGFVAGQDCHAVVETQRGHDLGRVIWQGGAAADTGQPEPVRGLGPQRVLRAARAGVFRARCQIGDQIPAGEIVAFVDGDPVIAQCAGVVRGLVHDGVPVEAGLKVGDIDPRGVRAHCFTISDKARAVAGGVLEAVLARQHVWRPAEVREP